MSKLSDYCDLIPGFAFKSKDFNKGSTRVVKIGDIKPPIVDMSKVETVDINSYNLDNLSKYYVKTGDFVIAMTGATIGKVGRIINGEGYINQRVLVFRPHKDVSDDYLFYILNSNTFKKFINNSIDSSSAQPNISSLSIGGYPITFPDYLTQLIVGKLLNTFDKKIKLNNSVNYYLEKSAKTLYDYWFLQFEFPNKEGKPYKSSGGKMVYNEELKREIPEGWDIVSLNKVSSIVSESVTPVNSEVYNHYSIPAFDLNKMPSLESGDLIDSNKYAVPKNCILVSKLNPQFKRIWPIIDAKSNSICSTEFVPIVAKKEIYAFLYGVVSSDAYSIHLVNNASASTGSRKRIQPENCLNFMFAYDSEISKRFSDIIYPIIEKDINILNENKELLELRDFLLPMLMNGQVTFKDSNI